MKYAIFDAANIFQRAHHVCSGDAFTKAGMALHIVFNSMRKVYREHDIDHIVIAGEGRSWRYDHYPEYKAKRILARKLLSPKEIEEQAVFKEVLDDLMTYFSEKTRMTIIQSPGCEGDDLIARWVQLHPDDQHVIISADSDNIQLLAPNVMIYDGITDRTIRLDGVYDNKGREMVFNVDTSSGKLKVKGTVEEERKKHRTTIKEAVSKAKSEEAAAKKALDAEIKKTGTGETSITKLLTKAHSMAKLNVLKAEAKVDDGFDWEIEEDFPKKALFLKIIRGDIGDGIFSANPGVRYKGSKASVGIEDAWNDRHEKGFHWNNFFLKRWEKLIETPDGGYKEEVRVLDEYHKNERLIDLTKQPQSVKDMMDLVIVDAVQKEPVGNIGIHFARFCAKHDLKRMGQDAADHAKYLAAPYMKDNK